MTEWKTQAYKRLYRKFRGQGMTPTSAHKKAVKESEKATAVKPIVRDTIARNFLIWAGKWAEANGGKVVVAGGIEVQKFPGDDDFTFRIAIKCTGRKPTLPTGEETK